MFDNNKYYLLVPSEKTIYGAFENPSKVSKYARDRLGLVAYQYTIRDGFYLNSLKPNCKIVSL